MILNLQNLTHCEILRSHPILLLRMHLMKRREPSIPRSALVERMRRQQQEWSIDDITHIVGLLLERIAMQLAGGGRVEIRGFGTFSTRVRTPRASRNPKTGQRVIVPARCVPRFSASRNLLGRDSKSLMLEVVNETERARERVYRGGAVDQCSSKSLDAKAG